MEWGSSLGKVAVKVFRIGHLGSLTDVMALFGIVTAEMAFVDLIFPVSLGAGVGGTGIFSKICKKRRA